LNIDRGNKIIDRKKKVSTNKSLIKRRLEELRRKAPECFTREEVEENKWALREWALAKLGLSGIPIHNSMFVSLNDINKVTAPEE